MVIFKLVVIKQGGKMISHIDHLVLTVADIDITLAFYRRVLCMEVITFANGRKALRFGNQKLTCKR